MQIKELAPGEWFEPAAGVRVTVLKVDERGAKLKVEAPAEIVIELSSDANINHQACRNNSPIATVHRITDRK